MDRKVKVVQIGTGKMAVYTMRYVEEKGGEVVGAVDVNPAVIGKDIGTIMGSAEKGVTVTALEQAREMLEQVKPDICIVETMSLLADVEDVLYLCAELGINAITTCEEAFYPWNSNPNATKKIDEIVPLLEVVIKIFTGDNSFPRLQAQHKPFVKSKGVLVTM